MPRELNNSPILLGDANLEGYWRLNQTELDSTSLSGDANLQGYWKLESDGTDSSGNGYTVAAGTAPTFVAGKFGNGADFEQSSSEFLTISNASAPNLDILGSQSWFAWVKLENISTTSAFMGSLSSGATSGIQFSTRSDSTLVVDLIGVTGTPFVSDALLTAGTFYHLGFVYDTSNVHIYINGVKKTIAASGSITAHANSFSLGRPGDFAGNYTDGIVDDVSVFDRALTDDEVAELYGANDLSGNSNNLAGVNAPDFVAAKYGTGTDFESSDSQQLEIEDGDTTGLDFTSSFTLVAWIKVESLAANIGVMGRDGVGAGGYGFDISTSGALRLITRNLNAVTTTAATGLITTGTFIHVTALFDDSADETRLYIDGKLVKTTTGQTGTLVAPAINFVIGAERDGVTFFDGIVDDAAAFSRVLTQAEIQIIATTVRSSFPS